MNAQSQLARGAAAIHNLTVGTPLARSPVMHRSFHVSLTDSQGGNRRTLDSLNTYEQARDYATAVYATAEGGQGVEIAHMGLTVWGPFIVGGKYKPEREIPGYYTVLVPWVPAQYATKWHCTDETGSWAYKTLTRGSFKTWHDACAWAREHLEGTPFSIRFYGDDLRSAAVCEAPNAHAVNIALTVVCTGTSKMRAHERVQCLIEYGRVREAFECDGLEITTATVTPA